MNTVFHDKMHLLRASFLQHRSKKSLYIVKLCAKGLLSYWGGGGAGTGHIR